VPGIENLGFGCVSLTRHTFLKRAEKILSVAFDNGIMHFDTAPVYGNGYSEKILGGFAKGKREKITIATKCGLGNMGQHKIPVQIALLLNSLKKNFKKNPLVKYPSRSQMVPYREITLDYVKNSLQNSLKNLQTDYVDYYLLHEALPSFLTSEAFTFLIEQKQKGVIRKMGVAAGSVNLNPLEADQLNGFEVLQYENGAGCQTDYLLEKFTDKTHFYHSVLKSINSVLDPQSLSEMGGIALARAAKINPAGKVLFSTTSIKRLNENVEGFIKFQASPVEELNKRIDAFYRS